MTIDIRVPFPDISKDLEDEIRRFQPVFARLLEEEIGQIEIRTRRGRGFDGSSFGRYSPGYAKFRRKRGRRTAPVDLDFTGRMLASMQSSVRRTTRGLSGEIFFNSAKEAAKARGHMTGRLGKRGRTQPRKFFGISRNRREILTERVRQELGRR